MTVQLSCILYANPIEPCGGMMIDVDTVPFESGPPAPNSGASNASTGVPAGTHAGHVPMVAGTDRCVGSGTNVAVPLYLMVFRVSQCPPILRRSTIKYSGTATFV